MDDEKSIAEKLTDAITKATGTVKNTMSHIVDTASQAAQYAMENNAERMSGQTATAANGRVYIPQVTDAAAMPLPLVAVQPVRKRKRLARTKLSPGNRPPAKKAVAKKAVKKSAPKKSKKGAKKSASKKSANKKSAKRIPKKPAKKARNKKGQEQSEE
jgi:hypothetical protein